MNPDWYREKNILILGGAGFIGSRLARECAARGARVTVVDGFLKHTGAHPENLAGIAGAVELITARIEETAGLDELLARSDLIIDAMALTAHHLGMADPLYDLELNVASHLHLIGRLAAYPGKRVVCLGSRGQYGRVSTGEITEGTPQEPVDSQGIDKLAAEHFFRIYSRLHKFNALALRITNCYGENQPVSGPDIGLVGSFIRDLMADKTIEVFGTDQRTKNLIYVGDLAEVVLDAGTRPFPGFRAYNVAGSEVTMKELLETLIGIIGAGRYQILPFPENIRQMDTGEARFSDAQLRGWIGECPVTPLARALAGTVEHFKLRIRQG